MKIDYFTLVGLAFLALALLLKLMIPLDIYLLKFFNSAMFSKFFLNTLLKLEMV